MKFVLALAMTACSTFAFSQNFVPAYVINHQGDTVRGFIDYNSSVVKAVTYRQTQDGDSKTYQIADVKGFGIVNGKSFQVKTLPINAAKTEVFAEVLVRGKANLYRYDNSFFIEKDTTIRALTQSTRDVKTGAQTTGQYQHVSKQYAGILNLLFLDCPGMSQDAMAVNLNERELTKITTRYNRCKGESYEAVKSGIPSFRVGFTAFVGYDVTSFSFTTASFQSIRNPESNATSSAPTIGVGAIFSNPREADRLFATVDLQLSKMTFDYSSSTRLGNVVYDDEYALSFTKLRIPIGLKYVLKPGTAVNYYGRIGYAMNMWLGGRLKGTQISRRDNVPPSDHSYDYELDNYSVGQFWVSLGTQFNKFKLKGFLELRAEGIGGQSNEAVFDQYGQPVIDPKSIGLRTFSLNVGVNF